ncbi:MAG TPA: GntR family transcriptional regulator [Spirochaetia bacterium]|nr:GntR family transcriptional regulator [Spirochaetia bacterium]
MSEKTNALRIVLDPTGAIPFYRQIILQIEMALADKRLTAGYQLPTVRGLAVELRVNPNTVARAYNELEIRGIVSTQQGSGTFISDKEMKLSDVEREQVLAQLVRGFVSQAGSYGLTVDDIVKYLTDYHEEGEK